MIKACLFDLDGVIVDTARYHYIAWRELAAELGFEFSEADNQRLKGTSRLDLDDDNGEVGEGLHVTSMAGTWMSVVEGFGGKRVRAGELYLHPIIPKAWQSYAFRLLFKGQSMEVAVSQTGVTVTSHAEREQ